jgi:hypothetical protein
MMVSIFFGPQALSHLVRLLQKQKKIKVFLIFSGHIPLETCGISSMLPTSEARSDPRLAFFYIHDRESQQELTSFDLKSTAFPNDMIHHLIIHHTYTDWVPDYPKSF